MTVSKTIPYGRQDISTDDINSVIEVLRSDFLTTGPKIDEFEKLVAQYCGARFGVACANASAALHLAARAIDLGPGHFLWTSPNTFVASANCADHVGAMADFVDIDPSTQNLSIEALEKKLSTTPTDKLPKAVVPVHFAGQPVDLEALYALKKKYGFAVIEDAAHALGSEYKGKKIGACQFSDMTIFSFHPVKNITTGEGGMIMTNDEALYDRLKRLRSLGITRDPNLMRNGSEGGWYYEQLEVGFNYRMTDLEAALGINQMKRLDSFVDKRNEIFDRYQVGLKSLPLDLPVKPTTDKVAWHLYVIQLKKEYTKLNRRQVFDALREAGVAVNVHYIPVHLQPTYERQGFKRGDFPNSESYYDRAISLPIFFSLGQTDQNHVIESLKRILL